MERAKYILSLVLFAGVALSQTTVTYTVDTSVIANPERGFYERSLYKAPYWVGAIRLVGLGGSTDEVSGSPAPTGDEIRARRVGASDGYKITMFNAYIYLGPQTVRTPPNLKTLLQTVVNRAGWSANNYAGFVLWPFRPVTNHTLQFYYGAADYVTLGWTSRIRVVYH